MRSWDVVVVGSGPGGKIATSLLAQAGLQVLNIDKAPAPYGQPRMSTLDGEIARVLQHAADPLEVMRDAIPARILKRYGADGQPVAPIDWDYKIAGHWSHYSLHQPHIESALDVRIASSPTAVSRWGWKAVAIEDHGRHVDVTIDQGGAPGREPERVVHRAQFVLGFDGASSFVREAAGIALDVIHEHTDRWILTDFDVVGTVPEELSTTQFHMEPARAWFAGPNGANRCRTDVRMLPEEDLETELAEEKGYAFMREHFGVTRDDIRMTRRIAYRFRSHIARAFRKGRIFIGGDAAHAMTPYMGQGACCAMRDAANIAWKLPLVLRGTAPDTLLDTYEDERARHSLFFIHGSLAAWKEVNEEDPEKARMRDSALRQCGPILIPIPGLEEGVIRRRPDGAPAPGAGILGPQGRVRLGDREGMLDDLIGSGGQLVCRGPAAERLGSDRLERLREAKVHTFFLADSASAPDALVDLESAYGGFLQSHEAAAFLMRPDFYLFGLAADPDDIVAMADEYLAWVSKPASRAPARPQPDRAEAERIAQYQH